MFPFTSSRRRLLDSTIAKTRNRPRAASIVPIGIVLINTKHGLTGRDRVLSRRRRRRHMTYIKFNGYLYTVSYHYCTFVHCDTHNGRVRCGRDWWRLKMYSRLPPIYYYYAVILYIYIIVVYRYVLTAFFSFTKSWGIVFFSIIFHSVAGKT